MDFERLNNPEKSDKDLIAQFEKSHLTKKEKNTTVSKKSAKPKPKQAKQAKQAQAEEEEEEKTLATRNKKAAPKLNNEGLTLADEEGEWITKSYKTNKTNKTNKTLKENNISTDEGNVLAQLTKNIEAQISKQNINLFTWLIDQLNSLSIGSDSKIFKGLKKRA